MEIVQIHCFPPSLLPHRSTKRVTSRLVDNALSVHPPIPLCKQGWTTAVGLLGKGSLSVRKTRRCAGINFLFRPKNHPLRDQNPQDEKKKKEGQKANGKLPLKRGPLFHACPGTRLKV